MTEMRSELSTKVGIFVQCWQEALDGLRHPLLLVPLLRGFPMGSRCTGPTPRISQTVPEVRLPRGAGPRPR